jgi:hypothetical protein
MQQIIAAKLEEIEKAENVKILYCAESGSRAWGFASPDSDYDVRFIYARRKEYYLRLDKTRDVIEWQLDDVLDINGWDIQKALRLLHTSNPTLFEWNASPIVYRTTEAWKKIAENIGRFFIPKAGVYHYLNAAKSNYREYLKGETVKLKKYFYVLRPLLACRWILAKGTPPPVPFQTLKEEFLDTPLKAAVDRLLDIKMHSPETNEGKRIDELNDYIDRSFAEVERELNDLPNERKENWEELDRLFLSVL